MEAQIQYLNQKIGELQNEVSLLTALKTNIEGGYKTQLDSLAPLQAERDALLVEKETLIEELKKVAPVEAIVTPIK